MILSGPQGALSWESAISATVCASCTPAVFWLIISRVTGIGWKLESLPETISQNHASSNIWSGLYSRG